VRDPSRVFNENDEIVNEYGVVEDGDDGSIDGEVLGGTTVGDMADWITSQDEGPDEYSLPEIAVDDEEPLSRAVAVIDKPRNLVASDEYGGNFNLRTIMTVGAVLARSGYFQDAQQEAQAIAKCMAGAELGIAPIAAMTGIYVVKGKIQIGAHILAALIRRSKRYTYRVAEMGYERCEIIFYERDANGNDEIGRSVFTKEDAKTANLIRNKSGEAWTGYVRNMLYARAMSNGVKWFCPDLTVFPVYTVGEIDGEIELPEAVKAGARLVDEGEIQRLESGPVTVLDD